MQVAHKQANKNPKKINHFKYQVNENEPKIHAGYDIPPEIEDELLDNGYVLKRRVWRNMRKIQRQYFKPVHKYHHEGHTARKFKTAHGQLLHKL